ncbi:hypothetical protein HY745_00360 [Candidatus Desantisbacteria bacterium]|nr:hypothetical protein [Candidatus Desantisbacteria bacterium]
MEFLSKIFSFFASQSGELFYNSHYIVSVVIVLFMLVYGWDRTKGNETLYLIIAFTLMLIRQLFIHFLLIEANLFLITHPRPFFPIVDSWLDTLSLIFLAWAFLYPEAKGKRWFYNYFVLNISLLVLYPVLRRLIIQISLSFFSGRGLFPVAKGSSFLLVDELAYNLWQLGIISFTILYLRPRKSPALLIKIFLGILFIIQILHLWNLVIGDREISLLINILRILPIIASFSMVLAIYQNIVSRLKETQQEIKDWNKKLEEKVKERTLELEKRNKDLARAEHMARMGRLAAGLAHEIKNPLNSIGINLELLKRYLGKIIFKEKEDMQDILKLVNNEVARLDSLIREFLLFARPQKIKPHDIDINRFLEDILNLVKAEAEKRNIRIIMNLSNDKLAASFDESLIKQVILNIIINAFDSMAGGGELKIIAEKEDADNSINIRIKDNGCGIKDEILPQIFEPFFSTKENGSGLGLSIAQRIVEEHSGHIDVKSVYGEGTVFTINLPKIFGKAF